MSQMLFGSFRRAYLLIMTDQYRRSIPELVTRYKFEPTLRDLYVEGERDQFMLEWFFHNIYCDNAVVYPIKVVEIPIELLNELDVSGNRGRVIALCQQLASRLSAKVRNVIGVIDKDDSDLVGASFSSDYLAISDFSCLECYALSSRTLDKFCRLYLGKKIEHDRIDEMFDILIELFLLRTAKKLLAKSASWLHEFTKFCDMKEGKITFDRDTFVERLSNVCAGQVNPQTLNVKCSELREKMSGAPREFINGHDLVQILSWFAHKINVAPSICSEQPLHRALITSVELEDLKSMPLFEMLMNWAQI